MKEEKLITRHDKMKVATRVARGGYHVTPGLIGLSHGKEEAGQNCKFMFRNMYGWGGKTRMTYVMTCTSLGR